MGEGYLGVELFDEFEVGSIDGFPVEVVDVGGVGFTVEGHELLEGWLGEYPLGFNHGLFSDGRGYLELESSG